MAGGGFPIPAVLKYKRRGRGDAQAPLDEGNGGGIGGASLPLPPSTGGHPLVAHGAAAPAGVGGGGSGGRWKMMPEVGQAGPKAETG
jgi:hypothetical protein